ncbi:major facilitator superfamily domain-containing protein [Xylariaceae sp. FL1651]|nr:major facilitator superfamily domain-containing protein [Xylariaceae sp. FL1651]
MTDETTSLLPSNSADRQAEETVDWHGPDDPQNALNWGEGRKWCHIVIMAFLTFLVPLGATMFAPAVPQAVREFDIKSGVLSSLVLSIYILGWMFGPLILGPASEIYGRLIVYTLTSISYVAFTVACALSPHVVFLVVFRFLAGCAGSAPLTLGGGTICDLVPVQERGLALSLYMLGPVIGPSIGPLVGGYLAADWGWRSVFWVLAAAFGITTLAQIIFMRETYAPVLLATKARHLQRVTGDASWRPKQDNGVDNSQLLQRAIARPAKLTLRSPINLLVSLISAYVNGLLFLLVATMPIVLGKEYGFSPKGVGLAFEGIGVGNLVGLAVFVLTSDRYVKSRLRLGLLRPEDRLPPVVAAAPMLAAGFLVYGWSAEQHVHWIVPILGTSLIGMGNILFFSSIIGYLIDAFPIHAASAVAANIIIRSLGGALLPLVGGPLYATFGWGWGSSVLAFVALAFTPFLVLLYTRGETVRQKFQVEL